VTGLVEFASIAWPGLLVLAGYVALIVHAARAHRRRHPRGHYRVRFEGPRGVLTAEHELTEEEARKVAALARTLVGAPEEDDLPDEGDEHAEQVRRWLASAHSRGLHRGDHADPDCYHCGLRDGQVLASRRDDLIAQGVDPRELRIPLAPDDDGYTDDAGMYRSRRRPGRAG
jgi:hypothetical protein